MPRHHRRAPGPAPLSAALTGSTRTERGPDGDDWSVREVSASAAVKTYRCPGCDHEIGTGIAHVVAWPADAGPADRRHWHRGCWRGRSTRRPTRR